MPLQHIVRQKVTVNTTKEEEKILRVLAEQRQHQYARVPDWICYDYLPLQSAPAHAVSKALRRRGSCCTRQTREQQCPQRWQLREKQKAAKRKKKNVSKQEAPRFCCRANSHLRATLDPAIFRAGTELHPELPKAGHSIRGANIKRRNGGQNEPKLFVRKH
jgi:hypothetical protein